MDFPIWPPPANLEPPAYWIVKVFLNLYYLDPCLLSTVEWEISYRNDDQRNIYKKLFYGNFLFFLNFLILPQNLYLWLISIGNSQLCNFHRESNMRYSKKHQNVVLGEISCLYHPQGIRNEVQQICLIPTQGTWNSPPR